ncbi:MAG: glycosyltransferase family 2 protein [Elusimicrobia bacterium]|nr:glycosyltransferase family 2 protein [Elusimicrobiota bacterium]
MSILSILGISLSNFLQLLIFLNGIFYLFLMLTGSIILRKKKNSGSADNKKIAVLVAAHNEENVISFFLESVLKADYPKDKLEIYAVLDHCSDKTQEICLKYPVNIILRNAKEAKPGKAAALNYATQKIGADNFDAFCYFDADSLMHPSFLKKCSYLLNKGALAVQGKQVSKNPNDCWLARIISVGQIISAVFFQKPKYFLGLSATFHGKGICLEKNIVKNFLWDENCLTEDLEMQMRLISQGIFIHWAEEAVVYDEQPVNIKQYMKRTIRWTRGSLDTAKKHLKGLFLRFLRKKDIKALEGFVYCANVYRLSLAGITAILIYLNLNEFNFLVWIYKSIPGARLTLKLFFLSPLVIIPFAILIIEKAGFKMLIAYFMQPILGIFRIPTFIGGIFKDRINWDRTEHSSAVAIGDIVKK